LYGQGSPRADLVVLISSPTEEEEYHRQFLMGPAGEMFDNMLTKVLQTSREKVYLLPALLCRGKGKLNPAEVEACRPLIEKQIEIIAPKVVLAMGPEAIALLGTEIRRGEWAKIGNAEVMPTWHPAEILADANRKRPTFQHLQLVQARLGQVPLVGR
jgi:DNA polymerase